MSRRLRIAQIGAGGIGAFHAARTVQVEGAELAAIVDLDETRAAAMQERFGIADRYTDFREALKRDDIDIVNICLPTWLHEEVVVEAARAGKHILCEKPMTLTLDSAERMLEAVEKAGVTMMVAFCRRFDNEWLKVRELLQGGALGDSLLWRSVHSIHGANGISWFVQKGRGEGPLMDGAIHNYDFARFMWGEAEMVFASTKSYRPDATAPDTGSAIIRFTGNHDLMVSWSWGIPKGASGSNMNEIIGPKGALFFSKGDRAAFAELPDPPAGHGAIYIDRGMDGGAEQHLFVKNDMYRDEIQAFVNAVAAGAPSPVDGVEGMKAVAIARAALDSGERGMPVFL